jgi:hypothetical protein
MDKVIIPEEFIKKIKQFGPHFIKVQQAVKGDPKSGGARKRTSSRREGDFLISFLVLLSRAENA